MNAVRYRTVDKGDGVLKRYRVVERRVRRQTFEGYVVRYTDSCTGCRYPDGSNEGCHECGYTGKVRHAEWWPFPDFTAAFERVWDERWKRSERLLSYFRARRRAA